MHWRRKWQPTPVFLPGESQGWGSLVGCYLWGCTESDTTEATAAAAEVTNCHLQRKRGKLSAKLPLQELLGYFIFLSHISFINQIYYCDSLSWMPFSNTCTRAWRLFQEQQLLEKSHGVYFHIEAGNKRLHSEGNALRRSILSAPGKRKLNNKNTLVL